MRRLSLNRRFQLEAETRLPDGAGGFVRQWQALAKSDTLLRGRAKEEHDGACGVDNQKINIFVCNS